MLSERTTVWVGGVASPRKAELVAALHERLDRDAVIVRTVTVFPTDSVAFALYVHAESDVGAMVETTESTRTTPSADVTVHVDWEQTDRSVQRIVATLVSRGLLAPREAA